MPAAGVEGTFCANCRGEKSEPEPIPLPLYTRVNVAEKTYDIFNARKLLVAAFASREEAEYLIKSANNHAQLVAALERFISIYPPNARRHPDVAIAIQTAEDVLSRVRE
jgi:hypothetical protein